MVTVGVGMASAADPHRLNTGAPAARNGEQHMENRELTMDDYLAM